TDVLLAIGKGYIGSGDHVRAVALTQRALAWRQRVLGPSATEVVKARAMLAEVLLGAGAAAAAIPQLDTLLVALGERHGPRSMLVATYRQSRARALNALGRRAEARRELREVITMLEDSSGRQWNTYAHAWQTLGHVARAQRDFAGAASAYRTALDARRRANGSAVEIANNEGDLGVALLDLGEVSAAESLLTRSFETKRRILGIDHPETGDDALSLARVALRQSRGAAALEWVRLADVAYGGATMRWDRQIQILLGDGAARLAIGDADGTVRAMVRLRGQIDSVGPSAPMVEALAMLTRAEELRGRPQDAARWRAECQQMRMEVMATTESVPVACPP
nr:tetratricopeptide repeat protein [Gemmatimonadaceae bacterium]